MLMKILLAGSGGQGMLTAGNILGHAAMIENYHVTYLPAYGAAVRGDTANCTICISDEEIASPVASAPDIVVAMNQPSAQTFGNTLEPGGQMIYNSNLVASLPFRGDLNCFPIAASDIAASAGSRRSANMVMLGAFVKLTNIVKLESVHASVEYMLRGKKKLVEVTKKAVDEGFNAFNSGNNVS